jgi:hypothetical protein
MSAHEQDHPFLEHDSVRLSELGAGEMDGNRPLVFVPRADITRIEVHHGCGAERPILMVALGLILIAIAAFSVLWLVMALLHGGIFYVRVIPAVALVIPGIWLIDLSLRKRWMLVVHTRRGTRKLLFKTSKDEPALHAFVSSARSRFGY